MSFRKRSVILTSSGSNRGAASSMSSTEDGSPATPPSAPPRPLATGVRPSILTGVPTTSTGTSSLDDLLSGHGGLPLGSLLLIEESSTTDFAGALLRYYAAEGIVQAHDVIVVGVGEQWGRELPGLSERKEDNEDMPKKGKEERMKIAWRYEALGNRRVTPEPTPLPIASTSSEAAAPPTLFCHTYDLTKRLTIPSNSKPPTYIPPPAPTSSQPFTQIITRLQSLLSQQTSSITRIVIPNLLSPLIYPPTASSPTNILQFIHTLRSLTRLHSDKLTIMISLPLSLYPRSTGLIRQLEYFSDATIELHPVPAFMERAEMKRGLAGEDTPQGLVRVWKAIEGKRGTGIVSSSTGGGGAAGQSTGGVGGTVGMEGGDDLAFRLTRRRMRIERFSLPVDDDDDGAGGGGDHGHDHKVHNPSSTVGEGVGGIVDAGSAVGGGHSHGHGKQTKVNLEF